MLNRKICAFKLNRQIVDLAFKMNKLKTKYNVLAQSKPESLSLSTALLAIYKSLAIIIKKMKKTILLALFSTLNLTAYSQENKIYKSLEKALEPPELV